MSIELTEHELNQLQLSFGGQPVTLDESTSEATENEGISSFTLDTGRIANFVYHYDTDSITVFRVDEAPPPAEITKINSLIESSEQFRSLLNN
jgi:hypothetical protein